MKSNSNEEIYSLRNSYSYRSDFPFSSRRLHSEGENQSRDLSGTGTANTSLFMVSSHES